MSSDQARAKKYIVLGGEIWGIPGQHGRNWAMEGDILTDAMLRTADIAGLVANGSIREATPAESGDIPMGRRGPRGMSDEKKRDIIDGWPAAAAEGITQPVYAKSKSIGVTTLRALLNAERKHRN